MQLDSVKQYLKSSIKVPYFLFVSDGQYKSALDELSVLQLDVIRISSFCSSDDKFPDVDQLISYIEAADINATGKKFVVSGLGEYLALRGIGEITLTLSRLKQLNVGGAKVILLLRGLASQISLLQADPRFDNRRFEIIENAECDISITLAAPSVGIEALFGFKKLLNELENGRTGRVAVNTSTNLDKSVLTIYKINSAYDGINLFTKDFALARSYGSDTQWSKLLSELNQSDISIESVFLKYAFTYNVGSDFYTRITGGSYENWLYFIYLISNVDMMQNGYLQFALSKTSRFDDFAMMILGGIIDISHKDNQFLSFYKERKVLVEKFPESDIADFVVNNRRVVSESIYKLTDNTEVERKEIIAWISQNGLIPELQSIYPALAFYLKKYVFKHPKLDFALADLLTEYFERYKQQKISNILELDFLGKVDELAQSPRKFNLLPTRNEIMDDLSKTDTYLYWIDALGVEYLAFIEELALKRGLSISINIARAELPTITSINRGFYDEWQGAKEKNGELDETKHKEKGGYNFTNNALPTHLAKELTIIASVINKAATELALRHCKRFLIVSDHGASRLAILRRKEEQYETDTKGEHSGRCCKLFKPYELAYATEENGYLVLADYGRFKGGRAANVEVHGGASLEEVVVPIIELALKDERITVKLEDEIVMVDYKTGTEIKLFFNAPTKNVSVVLNGKSYSALQTDNDHYLVKLPDTKRAGDYLADVYAGDNLIGKIMIRAQGKSGKVNDAFDDLF